MPLRGASLADASPATIRPLTPADLPGALRLSTAAHWNQTESDWLMMLALGRAWGIDTTDENGQQQLAASTVVLPYDQQFAWLSMVLVLPALQRQGFAAQLLRYALHELAASGLRPVLDATPAGRAVYAQHGFTDAWGFARYKRDAVPVSVPVSVRVSVPVSVPPDAPPAQRTRALLPTDWPAIADIDKPAFGADRLPLLRALAKRWPQAARVLDEGGRLRGFVLGRDGREARHIGPLVADDLHVAQSLLSDALQTTPDAVFVDLLDQHQALLPWLQALGFVLQRPFTRMLLGSATAPGLPQHTVLVAGPELG